MEYFEDIELGVEHEVGRHTPSRDEIIRFARQWDPQPFHVDEEAARASVFGGLSASSCHTYSISSLIFSRSPTRLRTAENSSRTVTTSRSGMLIAVSR